MTRDRRPCDCRCRVSREGGGEGARVVRTRLLDDDETRNDTLDDPGGSKSFIFEWLEGGREGGCRKNAAGRMEMGLRDAYRGVSQFQDHQ